ncbi:MAG: anaerobic sulfatase maturase [Steroidobacteraceae bacterium]
MAQTRLEEAAGVHLMAKPAGPICNLDCSYCFYLEKEKLFPERQRFLMSDEVLRAYVTQNIRNEPSPEVVFTWQGGEPMLRGLDFYRQAVAYQRELAGDKLIRNALQTNGVLLDDEWCAFLAESGFMVGISLDGPREIHDAARVDKRGRPTFDAVMNGIALLRKHQIEFNVLVTVTNEVSKHPKEIYRFLKQQGITHIQFNPVVERVASGKEQVIGLTFAQPGKVEPSTSSARVSPHSVSPDAYGDFLIAIFDEWVRHDVGAVYVMNFEWALASFMRLPATVCLFAENCGKALMLEHNGDVYSCDHFMYPDHRLGNLLNAELAALANSPQQQAFGRTKSRLPDYCQRCEVRFACQGECPKNRFATTPDGEPGLNYLCPSYKKYFTHIAKYMNAMAKLIRHGQPAALIMDAIKGPLVIHAAK